MIFIVKVITNKEDQATDLIADRSEKRDMGLFSVIRPHGLRGYILVESGSMDEVEHAISNLPYVKGFIKKKVSYEEIESIVTIKKWINDFYFVVAPPAPVYTINKC